MKETKSKKLYLPYYAFGKTSFKRLSSLPVVELPLSHFNRFFQDTFVHYSPFSFSEQEKKELISQLYLIYFKLLLEKNSKTILLGAADSDFYQITKSFFGESFDIITFIPLRELKDEYWRRFRGRISEHPGDDIPREVFETFWKKDHDFFEKEAEKDPGIIFVRSGEYLSDYLDIETGKLREEMLFR